MPFSKPCIRCGKLMKNRTKFQEVCDNCKSKSKKRKRWKKGKRGKEK
jgi:hypothetical protein